MERNKEIKLLNTLVNNLSSFSQASLICIDITISNNYVISKINFSCKQANTVICHRPKIKKEQARTFIKPSGKLFIEKSDRKSLPIRLKGGKQITFL